MVSRDNLIVIVLVTVLTTYLATKVLGAIPWAALWYRRHDIANRDEPAPTARDGESGGRSARGIDDRRAHGPRTRLRPRFAPTRRVPRR